MNHLERLLSRYPDLAPCETDIRLTVDALISTYRVGGKVLICGNGGSAADSEHIVGELMKGYMLKRPVPPEFRQRLHEAAGENGDYLADHLQGALPAISLVSQTSLLSAYANDVAADMAYAQQVYGYGRPGDALIGISTSGNAKDVLHAFQVARGLHVKTIGLTGLTGGAMRPFCDVAVCVPSRVTPDIQERHLAVYHAICVILEEAFFEK